MKKPIAILFPLLCAASLFAAGPGRGEIVMRPGNGIEYLRVVYDISQFFGEPTVNGAFEWRAQSGFESTLPSNTTVWLEVRNEMGGGFIEIRPTLPKSGEGMGFNFTGSPDWDDVIALNVDSRGGSNYVDEETAKNFWRAGFRVVAAHLVW